MSFIQGLMTSRIAGLISASDKFAALEHNGLKGRWRELLVSDLIGPLLPHGIKATTGILIDSKGNQSKQLDIIIYNAEALPPLLELSEQALIPVDAAIQVIEVKSMLNAHEMKDCLEKAISVKSLFLLLAGEIPSPCDLLVNSDLKTPCRVPTIFSIFAFGSNLTEKSEWRRYQEVVDKSQVQRSQVLVNDICVLGRGYWSTTHTEGVEADSSYGEVLSWLIPMVNSLPYWKKMRGIPALGQYLRSYESD